MSAKRTCDTYFGVIVRARGACQRCGARERLECAHIIRRRFVGDPDGIVLRHNEANAWCLCHDCHALVDSDEIEFGDLVMRTIGREKFSELAIAKRAHHRPWRESDWVRERARLLALKKEAV